MSDQKHGNNFGYLAESSWVSQQLLQFTIDDNEDKGRNISLTRKSKYDVSISALLSIQ